MIKNFLKIAWRNLMRNKSFSFINITGLAIGMTAAVLIFVWIFNETSIEQFHANKDRIYEAYNKDKNEGEIWCWNTTPKLMASTIQQDYPEVEKVSRVNWTQPLLFSYGDKKIKINGNIVDAGFLNMFSFPIVKGTIAEALGNVNGVALTESAAKKVFGDEEPIGKMIKVDNKDNFTVTAILKDLPVNSSFDFEYLIPWSYLRQQGGDDSSWGNNSTRTYVMLKQSASIEGLNNKLKTLRKKYDTESPAMETFLYPITRSYLYGSFKNGIETGGRIEMIRMFVIIAIFILLIACINFMNLSTARSEKRAKEVGIRKVVGAEKRSLIGQFLGESILLSLIAAVFAFVLVFLLLPSFGELVGKKLTINYSDYRIWLAALGFIIITGLLAGSYPALYLSAFKPVLVLKGTFNKINASVTPRKILVVAQFTFAIILIISTIIVKQQLQKAQDRQAGYSKDNLGYFFIEGDVAKNYNLIKQELLSSGVAVSVNKTSSPLTEGWSNSWGLEWKGKAPNDKTVIDRVVTDNSIVKTAGLQLVAGRDFDLEKYPTDSTGIILNESSVKLMKFKNPIGEIVKDNGQDWHVIGVVKDFILRSPYRSTEPLVFEGAANKWFSVVNIKYDKRFSTKENLAKAEAIYKKYNSDYPFQHFFVDEAYERKFRAEKRTGNLASLFTLLTIIISCLGLFGLASYMAENRIKEIGVRKVLGASVSNLTKLLSIDFLKLVTIAFVIAAPIAYWAMYKWLQDYEYRTTIHWWVFVLSGGGAMLIAFLTVSYQAIKAALANPVKSLRTE